MILKPGDAAPLFQLPRLNPEGASGPERVALQDVLKIGPTLLVFAKVDCPTSRWAAPFFNRIFAICNGGSSVLTIAQETPYGASRMAREWELRMPILLDADPYPVSESYGLTFVPGGFLVSPGGIIENSFESFEREEIREIARKLAAHSGAVPPEIFQDEGVPPFRPG